MEPFSFENLALSFKSLSVETVKLDAVPMVAFIQTYKELIKLFDVLGRGFSFVKTDLVSKITILEEFAQKENGKFDTVEKLVHYEVESKILVVLDSKGYNISGSRTLVRLVRALDFIQLFMKYIEEKTDHELGQCCRIAYDETLANYHGWAIRKAASVAFYLLPTKKDFVKQIYPTSPSEEKTMNDLHILQTSVGVVLTKTKDLLAKNDLNNLP